MTEMSAIAQKNLEAKHEKILKELSRVAANRKCVDCDNMGPQYVITSYGVFVCTACGGLHRQYGHRVKGIFMSRFSKEEIAALQDGGNEKFMSTYCATWTATALPRPTDRNPERTKAWIEEIYQNQKYFSSSAADIGSNGNGKVENSATPTTQGSGSLHTNGHATPSAVVGSGDSTISNEEDIVHVLELSNLGAGMAKLEIGGPVVATTSSSSSSPSKQPKSPRPAALPKLQMPMPLPAAAAASPVIKPVSSPTGKSETKSPRPAPAVVEAVEVPESETAAAPVAAAPTPSLMDAWDPFGEVEAVAPPTSSSPQLPAATSAATTSAAPIANGISAPAQAIEDASSGWDAFAEEVQIDVPEAKAAESTTPAALDALLAPAPSAAKVEPTAPAAAPAAPGWAVDFGSQSSISAPPQQQQQQQQQQKQQSAPTPSPPPPAIPGRKEISLDTFYPEFETIRATGVLPTGQPVLQAQMTQWGVSPYSQQQQQSQHATHQFGIVPPSPAAGGHAYMGALTSPGYAHLSPQQQQQIQYQQHQQQHHGVYSAGTPTAPAYYPPPSPAYGQQPSPQALQQQYISPSMVHHHHQQQQRMQPPSPLPSPVTSVASVGRPASGASTASSQGKLVIDPFAHLSPAGVGYQGQMQATVATPTPPSPSPPPPSAAPAAGGAVGPGSQTQAASATLFGIGTSLTAYDLSAPAAPKPRASGNPFA